MKVVLIGFLILIISMLSLYFIGKSIIFSHFGSKVNPNLSGHYWINGNKIKYSITDGASTAGASVIQGADHASFEVISKRVARDKFRAYYNGEEFENVDKNSMKTLWGPYFMDKDHVYYENNIIKNASIDETWMKVKNDTSKVWIKSESSAYFYGDQVAVKDINTLEVIENSNYSKDSKLVYYKTNIIESADPNTFSVSKTHGAVIYAKDAKHVYINGNIIEGADPSSFMTLQQTSAHKFYFKDKDTVFYQSSNDDQKVTVVEDADPHTFKEHSLEQSFFTDKNHIYSFGRKIRNSDSKSLIKLNHSYSKDKNNIYRYGYIVKDVDKSYFTKENIKEIETWKVYFYKNEYPEISTVTVAPKGEEEIIDENYLTLRGKVYYGNNIIPDADINTFKPVNNFISTDKTHVFIRTDKLTNTHPKDFTFNENMKFKDSNIKGYVLVK